MGWILFAVGVFGCSAGFLAGSVFTYLLKKDEIERADRDAAETERTNELLKAANQETYNYGYENGYSVGLCEQFTVPVGVDRDKLKMDMIRN